MRKLIFLSATFLFSVSIIFAQEKINIDVINKIKKENRRYFFLLLRAENLLRRKESTGKKVSIEEEFISSFHILVLVPKQWSVCF